MNPIEQAEYLAEKYANDIFRLSYAYLKNTYDAQDVCQTVFLKLLSQPREFENTEQEKSYVLKMAANACKDILKSPWRSKTTHLGLYIDIPAPAEGDNPVLAAVNALPARYRSVIYLHYYEGYQADEISEILGISVSAVYTRLNRGRKKLKSILGGVSHE